MLDNKMIENVIEKLNIKTVDAEMDWKRAKDLYNEKTDKTKFFHKYVKREEIKKRKKVDDLHLSLENSFYTRYKEGKIFIFRYDDIVWDADYYILAVQSHNAAEIKELNALEEGKGYQAELIRLYKNIKRNINNIDGFISDFLDDF